MFEWHAFAIAVLQRSPQGKTLVVFDSEPNIMAKSDRAAHILKGLQRDIWDHLQTIGKKSLL